MTPAILMWRNTRMVVLTGVVAALYASAQVALAPINIPVIPGVVMFKTADVFTMLLGVLAGPAGAFGLGIGNTISDFFLGGLGVGSVFGFLSSVAVGFVGYAFWLRFRGSARGRWFQVLLYLGAGSVGAAVSAVLLAWGLEMLGIAPFRLISNLLVLNFTIGSWIGLALYFPLYERLGAMGLVWTDMMEPVEIGQARSPALGALLLTIGGFGGWILGAYVVNSALIVPIGTMAVLFIVAGALLL